ncbi:MAG: hypothetical protein WDW38_001226 [Sanguina aurantia]
MQEKSLLAVAQLLTRAHDPEGQALACPPPGPPTATFIKAVRSLLHPCFLDSMRDMLHSVAPNSCVVDAERTVGSSRLTLAVARILVAVSQRIAGFVGSSDEGEEEDGSGSSRVRQMHVFGVLDALLAVVGCSARPTSSQPSPCSLPPALTPSSPQTNPAQLQPSDLARLTISFLHLPNQQHQQKPPQALTRPTSAKLEPSFPLTSLKKPLPGAAAAAAAAAAGSTSQTWLGPQAGSKSLVEKPGMTMEFVHGYVMESDVLERLIEFVEGSCAGVCGACGDGMEASRVGISALVEGDSVTLSESVERQGVLLEQDRETHSKHKAAKAVGNIKSAALLHACRVRLRKEASQLAGEDRLTAARTCTLHTSCSRLQGLMEDATWGPEAGGSRAMPDLVAVSEVLSYLVSSTYRREGEEGLTLEGAGNVPASITEAMRERLLGAGVLQALLRLWPSLQLAQEFTNVLASLLQGLELGSDLVAGLEKVLQVLLLRKSQLDAVTMRVSARVKQVADEAHRAAKSINCGYARGNSRQHYPLTAHNTMASTVRASEVEARLWDLEREWGELLKVLSQAGLLTDRLTGRAKATQLCIAALLEGQACLAAIWPGTTEATEKEAAADTMFGHSSESDADAVNVQPSDDDAGPVNPVGLVWSLLKAHTSRGTASVEALEGLAPSLASALHLINNPPTHLPALLAQLYASPCLVSSPATPDTLTAKLLASAIQLTLQTSSQTDPRAADSESAPRTPLHFSSRSLPTTPRPPAPTAEERSADADAQISAKATSFYPTPTTSTYLPAGNNSDVRGGVANARPASATAYRQTQIVGVPNAATSRPASARTYRATPRSSPGSGFAAATSGTASRLQAATQAEDEETLTVTNLIASLNTASQATGTQPGSRVGAAKKLANAFEGSMYEMMVNTHSPSRGSAPGMSGSAVGWRVPSKAGAAAAAVAAGSGGGRMGGTARAVAPTKRGSDDDQFKFIQEVLALTPLETGDKPSQFPGRTPDSVNSHAPALELGRQAVASLSTALLLRETRAELDAAAAGQGGASGGVDAWRVERTFFEALMDAACSVVDVMLCLCTLRRRADKAIQLSHLLASRLPYPSFFDRDTLLPMLPELLTRQVAAAKSHPGLGASLSRTASSLCTQQRLLEGHDSTYEPAPLLEESDFEPVFVDTGLWQLQLDILRGPSREEKESKDGGQDGIGGGGRSGGRPRQTRENTATVDPRVRQVFGVQRNLDRTAAAVAVWDVGLRFEGARRMLVEDEKALSLLVDLASSHTIPWAVRLAVAEVLSLLLLGGDQMAEAVIRAGGALALLNIVRHEVYPWMCQDPRGGKEHVVAALGLLGGSLELRQAVVEAEPKEPPPPPPRKGQTAARVLDDVGGCLTPRLCIIADLQASQQESEEKCDMIQTVILRLLWNLVDQVPTYMTQDRAGKGRFVDKALVEPLMCTAVAAAEQLSSICISDPSAKRVLKKLGVRKAVSSPVALLAIKDTRLLEAIQELKVALC